MKKEPSWIKFYVLDVKEKTDNPSGLYAIFCLEAAYNEFYDNELGDLSQDNELDEVPHINLFYKFQLGNYFKSLKKGYSGFYQKKWCDESSSYILKIKNLNFEKDHVNYILLNINKFLRSYRYSYSIESINLDTSIIK